MKGCYIGQTKPGIAKGREKEFEAEGRTFTPEQKHEIREFARGFGNTDDRVMLDTKNRIDPYTLECVNRDVARDARREKKENYGETLDNNTIADIMDSNTEKLPAARQLSNLEEPMSSKLVDKLDMDAIIAAVEYPSEGYYEVVTYDDEGNAHYSEEKGGKYDDDWLKKLDQELDQYDVVKSIRDMIGSEFGTEYKRIAKMREAQRIARDKDIGVPQYLERSGQEYEPNTKDDSSDTAYIRSCQRGNGYEEWVNNAEDIMELNPNLRHKWIDHEEPDVSEVADQAGKTRA